MNVDTSIKHMLSSNPGCWIYLSSILSTSAATMFVEVQ